MKIVCIYGQNHKGSTYHIAKIPWDYARFTSGEIMTYSHGIFKSYVVICCFFSRYAFSLHQRLIHHGSPDVRQR